MKTTWFRFPNGRPLEADENGYVEGVVHASVDFDRGFEGFLDDLSEALIGGIACLSDISYRFLSADRIWVRGCVDMEESEAQSIAYPGADWHMAFALHHGLTKLEIEHASAHGVGAHTSRTESVHALPGGRELRISSRAGRGVTLRACVPGVTPIEIARWETEEANSEVEELLYVISAALAEH